MGSSSEFYKDRVEEEREIKIELVRRLNKGRNYLLKTSPDKITIKDTFEAFGFNEDGSWK